MSTMSITTPKKPAALRPTVIACNKQNLNNLLATEWLRTNRLGAYSSSTIVGCNVRRYHGLLVAAANPPVGRIVALSTIMEQLIIGKEVFDLATNEFAGKFSPNGLMHMETFRDDVAATFIYKVKGVTLKKLVLLSDDANAVTIRYELTGKAAKLLLRPFTPMRDFHSLQSFRSPGSLHSKEIDCGALVREDSLPDFPLHICSTQAEFKHDPQWWYRVLYRADVSRGQEGFEDIYSPGLFVWKPGKTKSCELTASLGEQPAGDFKSDLAAQKLAQAQLAASVGPKQPRAIRRLAAATDAFIVNRPMNDGTMGKSITAGYPWFADWGRDTFIALPGLLLSTGRYAEAREVFETYANNISEGMIPNRFDDYGGPPHYNSIDASLWFILAAERYLTSGDAKAKTKAKTFGRKVLLPACEEIVTHYRNGTRFSIHEADDGLLWGGDYDTQLTWMDAKLGDTVITARYGKAVETNALWYCANCMLANRLANIDRAASARYAEAAETIGKAFVRTFWNEQVGWLNDYVNENGPDASLRPNQIFAVSLPYSPLSDEQQQAVVRAIEENLLTPLGLRTLSPRDTRYRSRYGGSWESRERAYHQGTVWAWLIGPFIEAYLKVKGPAGVAQATRWLKEFDSHLDQVGLGSVSEIFDGDNPHTPRGCISQAWSVAEVLRAKLLIAEMKP
ncbi:MAG: amylo-alpha-1,6-glucosidase [Phycisphaerae bacterium]|nr:amylo-alpha-1,6-glucosidase [Phycisphaerae bacterium]